MKKKRRTKKVAFSIRSKLLLLLSASMLPFLLIAVYLLISIANYNQTYHEIVDHLTIANTYNIQFKEQMDESLYKVVVGYVSMDNIANDETLKDPYVLIRNLKKSCTGLRDVTSDYESRMWLDSLLRNVDTLKNRVDDIAENVKKGDRYDENIRQLDDNIYILTELIQEDIQYYIYYQTNYMEAVTNTLNQQIHTFVIVFAVVLAALGIVVGGAGFFVTSGILRPLRQLYNATGEISEGNFAVRTHVKSHDEVAVLALKNRVDDIAENVKKGDRYDENIRQLDDNIYILTELIQEDIQYYIYYQTNYMEAVTNTLNQQIHTFVIVFAVVLAALGIVVGGAGFFVTSGILRPLRQLYNATGEISEGNFAVRTHVKSHDEVAVLAHGFNDMAENIQILVNKVREDEQKMRKADLRLLQEQINPHFLYNTLDTIVWLIECNETEQATEMVVTLSDFFRLVLSHGQEFISIRMEEQHVRSYLQIQEIRYHDIMEYHILIDPELYDYQIPKMTLQPIVENALYHGIKCKRSKGQICIRGEKKQDLLILTVTDDGVGMEEADLQDLQKEIEKPCKQTDRGFGLANVNERLHMYFGAEYGVKIASRPGEGTQVTIVIPAVHNITGEAMT